jgi:hypothetical protein
MTENTNMSEVVAEIKNATEEELRDVVAKWFEQTRIDGMKIGAQYIAAAIFGIIKKHLKKTSAPSLRDYKRCIDEVASVIAVQLATTNETEDTVEEPANDE